MFIKDLTSVLLEMYENSTMIHGHFQTLTCSSMADSDLGFIAVYSRHCLTAPSKDGTRESRTIPALLLHMLHETTLLLLQSK